MRRFDYPCNGSIAPDICMLRGSAQELAPRCDSDPACRAMVFLPSGWDYQRECVPSLELP